MCEHLERFDAERTTRVRPSGHGCQECLERGDAWVHLRLCMTCGHEGCCDSSPNRHATAHYHATEHPVIKSYEPGEDWVWCFVHEEAVDAIEAFPEESPSRHISAPEP